MGRGAGRPSWVRPPRRLAALLATLVVALAGCTTTGTDARRGGSPSALSTASGVGSLLAPSTSSTTGGSNATKSTHTGPVTSPTAPDGT